MQLFSEKFELIENNEELDILSSHFPSYDRAYLCQATNKFRAILRNWLEQLWVQYEPYSDSHFLQDFRHQFTQRCWEMYLGVTFLNRGFSLAPHSNEGPDFDLRNPDNKRVCWVEAIAVKKGRNDSPDRVPNVIYDTVGTVPTEQIVLRISAGLKEKFQKYISDKKKGIVQENDPYVIALDRSETEHVDAQLPNILKAVFGIGDQAFRLRVGGKPVKNPETFWTHLPSIKKQSGNEVSMHFFTNPEHAGISAVIYSKEHVIDSPRHPEEMGENFFIVHNPLAKNSLPLGTFPFGTEYALDGEYLKITKNARDFTMPDPFEDICN